MKAKMGRPKVPKSEKHSVLMVFKLRPDEAKRVRAAIARSPNSMSEWLRNAALAAANGTEAVS